MKSRRDYHCPCHRGGVAVHVVPCCEEMLSSLFKKRKESGGKRKESAKRTSKGEQILGSSW